MNLKGAHMKTRNLWSLVGSIAVLAGCGGPVDETELAAWEEPGQVRQSLLTNGSFESGPATSSQYVPLSPGSTAIPGWTISGGGIDYITTFWLAADGSKSIDLSSGTAGAISQTFLTTPGYGYAVYFTLAGNPYAAGTRVKRLRVEVAGVTREFTFDTTGRTGSNMGWQTYSFYFAATSSSTTLTFRSLTYESGGPALDNVYIVGI
jgi:choice-of-anchor C domain-containing protein